MLSHIPSWVFGVLVALLAFGFWFTRPRAVSPIAPAIMAVAFLGYSIFGVFSSFGLSALAVLAWVTALIASITVAAPLFTPPGLSWVEGTNKVHVPGSWMPMFLMLGIFLVRFAIGFSQGARLPVANQQWFAPVTSFLLGSLSGGFVARALVIRRFAGGARDA